MDKKVTCEEIVLALKKHGLSITAKGKAAHVGTSSRAVGSALRKAEKDGRVARTFKKGLAWYRFKRLTPNCGVTGSGR